MTNEITLDKRRINKVVKNSIESTKKIKDLEAVEAIVGFAEALGRIIAAQDMPEAGHQELIRVSCLHVISTVKSAYEAQGIYAGNFEVH